MYSLNSRLLSHRENEKGEMFFCRRSFQLIISSMETYVTREGNRVTMPSVLMCAINFDARSFRAKSPTGMKSLYADLKTNADVEMIAEDGGRERVRFKSALPKPRRFFGSSEKFGPMALKLQPEFYQSNVKEIILALNGMEPYVVSCFWLGHVEVDGTRYTA